MKFFLTLSFAFFSLVSFAQNNVLEDQAVRRCEVMPAFGQCIELAGFPEFDVARTQK